MGRALRHKKKTLGGELDDFPQPQGIRLPHRRAVAVVSIDTHVIGMVVRGATGGLVTDLLVGKGHHTMGLEHAPYYVTDGGVRWRLFLLAIGAEQF